MKAERVERVPARRQRARVGDKKLAAPRTLFAAIEADQHGPSGPSRSQSAGRWPTSSGRRWGRS